LRPKSESEECYVQLVKSESRLRDDDLSLLFSADLDRYSNSWIFIIGLIFTGLVTISEATRDLDFSYRIGAILSGTIALLAIFYAVISRQMLPHVVARSKLKCYLTAREMLPKALKDRERYVCPVHGNKDGEVAS
jgi:hypothetical protein